MTIGGLLADDQELMRMGFRMVIDSQPDMGVAREERNVSYMMSKDSYLTDEDGHNLPHMMFYETADAAAWGANLTNSPVMGANYWYISAEAYPLLKSFPPLSVFLVGV